MAWLSFLDPVLNVIFWPILQIPPLAGIILIAFLMSLIITLIYKYTTDQNLMKQLKTEMKEFQKQVKELKARPEEAMKVQKKAMETNMKYMMHSMKPTLFTFIPIILIFGWLQGHMAFDPLISGQEFSVDMFFENDGRFIELAAYPDGLTLLNDKEQKVAANKVSYVLKGISGKYSLEFLVKSDKDGQGKSYKKEILITDKDRNYIDPIKNINEGGIKKIVVGNKKAIVLNLFGWKLGWLGAYILFSIIFSLILRKTLKIY